MKAENLKILRENGYPVPEFIVVESENDHRINDLSNGKYAVRSSSEVEDSDNESYAGQFHTELNVEKDGIRRAVKKVLESGKKRGCSMKVIIQEMVDADYSGVLFTANPMGILNEAVIVIGKGLGENVVEDKVETTAYYYNLDDDLFYHEQQEGAVLVGNDLIKELIETGKSIRDTFDKNMDIEFAVKDGRVYVLQARPITTLHYKRKVILDNSNIVESYPGISLPLTQSFVREIYRDIFRAMVLRLTENKKLVKKMEPVFQNMVTEANGRVYYDITNWYNVLSLVPFSGKIISVWQEMLGVRNKDVSIDFRTGFFEKAHVLFLFLKYLRVTPKEMEKLNEKFIKLYPEYIHRVQKNANIKDLLQVYDDIEEELIPLWDITLVNDMYAFIYTHLAGKRHPDEISDIKDLESMRPVRELNSLIRTASERGIKSGEYQKKRESYINKYGDRCLEELKLETRTYRTDPKLLDEYVKSRMKDRLPENTEGKKVTDSSYLVRRAKTGIANRERSRMNRTRIFGIVRYIALKIGAEMTKQGKLSDPRDVFYLTLDELRKEAVSPAKAMHYIGLIRERKDRYAGFANIPAYSRLIFADHVIDKPVRKIRADIICTSSTLSGIPSSPGKVRGEVLVIDHADQMIDTKGKIIVTKMTDPGWVFLIRPSLGIVAEKGSMLSHTAIITRELKKPSVVNVKDVTKILKTGDMIELDAYNGSVTIL